MTEVLIVEDTPESQTFIRTVLAKHCTVHVASTGEEGLQLAKNLQPDAIILDVNLPGIDGYEVCRRLKASEQTANIPVVFLSAHSDVDERMKGFEAGGDDYLSKPFHLKELLLRVAAILRRSSWYQGNASTLEFGGNRIDFKTYEARAWDGSEHALTHKEAMILKALNEHSGGIVTREDILDRVWGYEVFPSTRTIDNFIVRLRKRFERNPEQPAHFHTVRGVGYRFTPEPQADGNP